MLGRDVTSIMRLLPGVRYENTVDSLGMSFGTSVPNVGGARRDWSNVIVDGVVANEVGASSLMAQQINLDAIAEVRVLLNSYRAEYGRAGGGQVQIVSKSGGVRLPRQPLLLRPQRGAQRERLLQQPREHQEAALPLQHLRRQPRRPGARATSKKLFFFYSMEAPLVSRPGPVAELDDADRRRDAGRLLADARRAGPADQHQGSAARPGACNAVDGRARLLPRQHHPGQPHQPERPGAAEHAAARQQLRPRRSRRDSSTTRRRRTPTTRR